MNFEVLGIMQDLKRDVKVLELLQRLRDGFKILDELITTEQDVNVKELITIIERKLNELKKHF